MIPLARWLETGSPAQHAAILPPDISSDGDAGEIPGGLDASSTPAIPSDPKDDYIAKLEASLRLSQDEAERVKDDARQREKEMLERLGASLAETIADGVASAMSRLRYELEAALADLLTPFMSENIRQRAINDLLDLVAEAVAGAESLELDIHAPSDLHASLGESLAGRNLTVRLHESSQLVVSCGSQRSRFEELSRLWLSQLDGGLK